MKKQPKPLHDQNKTLPQVSVALKISQIWLMRVYNSL